LQEGPRGRSTAKSCYPLAEAIKMVKERATSKFDETIEIAVNLGVDPRHADQMVRGVVTLPNGTGRTLRVGVFARGAKADEAKRGGCGRRRCGGPAGDRPGWCTIEFDRCIATPDLMPSGRPPRQGARPQGG
jgi:large subunit ribosomal protein L1